MKQNGGSYPWCRFKGRQQSKTSIYVQYIGVRCADDSPVCFPVWEKCSCFFYFFFLSRLESAICGKKNA